MDLWMDARMRRSPRFTTDVTTQARQKAEPDVLRPVIGARMLGALSQPDLNQLSANSTRVHTETSGRSHARYGTRPTGRTRRAKAATRGTRRAGVSSGRCHHARQVAGAVLARSGKRRSPSPTVCGAVRFAARTG